MQVLSNEGYSKYHQSTEMQALLCKCYSFIHKDGVLNSAFYGQISTDSAFMMSLNQKWFKDYLINFDFSKIEKTLFGKKLKETSKLDSYVYYLWDSSLKDPLLEFNRHFKINAGFDIYLRQNTHVELLSIGGEDAHKVHNYGINNIGMLLKIMQEIRDMVKHLSDTHRVLFPIKLHDKISKKYFLVQGNKVSISNREFEYLKYLGLGYSMKSLARELSISPRTVESHIQNLKIKTGLFSKEQLIKEFCTHNFIISNPI